MPRDDSHLIRRRSLTLLGVALLPLIWIFLKAVVGVSDRYLPAVGSVFTAFSDIEPNVFVHLFYTTSRFVIGFSLGTIGGIGLALLCYRYDSLRLLLLPSIEATRAVPAVATIPFFLLWFGFSETGRYVLTFCGTGFNIAIATLQILARLPERYRVMFAGFRLKPQDLPLTYCLPVVVEGILPTLRFSLSAAVALVVASELLGSQIGLGYLIQSARSTFSMHVVFLATILLGALNSTADRTLIWCWKKLLYWK
jgi:sulfonate transport system permease protein